jgi:hypothetical protein
MTSDGGVATLLEESLTRLGVSTNRNPDEDDQAYISRMILEAPPEVALLTVRQNAPVRIAPCECVECLQQFRTTAAQKTPHTMYTKHINWKSAQVKCNTWIQEITSSQDFLRDAINKQGNTIISRWKKRSVAKRSAILTSIFPNIAPKKHELLEKNYIEPFQDAREKQRKFYLAPYFTLDQLTSDPMRLLSILHARAHYDSEDWAAWDVLQTEVGWRTGKLAVEHCGGSVVMFGARYGQVVQWKEDQAHCWTTIGYPRAQLVLESQAMIMGTIRKVVEHLLEGVEIESMSSKWDELVKTEFRRSRDEETWAIMSNQAFLWPPRFQANIVELCRSRLALAQDELWLLQTDPSYIQQTIAAARNMKLSAQMVKAGDRFQVRVCQAAIMLPVRRVHEWHDVVTECQNLRAAQEIHLSNIRCGRALPVDYENAAGCLEIRVINLLINRTEDLLIAIQESPAFEDHFIYFKGEVPDTLMCKLKTELDTAEIFREDPLFWCLMQMTGHPEEDNKFDPAVLFAFFDDIVATDSSATGRVDSRLLDQISDLAALWELLRAVRLHRPLARSMHMTEALSMRSGGGWEGIRAGRKDRNAFKGKRNEKIYSTVLADMPLLMAAKMPSGRRDEHWLQKAEKSRAALSRLWNHFRDTRALVLRYAGYSEKLIDAYMAMISFDRSEEYQEALRAERVRIMARQQNLLVPIPKEGAIRWPSANFEAEKGRGYSVQEKTKVKTRAADPVNGDDNKEAPSEEPAAIIPTIKVKIESLQIFCRMFPSSDEDSELSSSMIDWRKFVIAMADAGFACRHNTGSAVTFNNNSGRIVIHKPHPVAKLDFRSLMKVGKRLNKWFGFVRETFEVA